MTDLVRAINNERSAIDFGEWLEVVGKERVPCATSADGLVSCLTESINLLKMI